MTTEEKKALTLINKIAPFGRVMESLTINGQQSEKDLSYILTCAILFLKYYQEDNRYKSYAEFAYYIILKYSITYGDYKPLYDFSASFGFYPTVKAILDNGLIEQGRLEDLLLDIEVGRFRNENYIETLHQFTGKRKLLKDPLSELGYIAPTSFGKSSVIIDYILQYNQPGMKIGVIVPTKSLLMQTYRMIRDAGLDKKIIIHDEMYQEEEAFIAVFTQERALRLFSKFQVHFDVLFIDEAHNLLKDDSRSVLLARLLAKNRNLNPEQRVVYLSPLIDEIGNLKVDAEQVISEHRIPFNIKEPEIFEYRLNRDIVHYNRFVNEFYSIGSSVDMFAYILQHARKKNFLYNYRPVKIEELAKELSARLPALQLSSQLSQLINVLKQEVHERFFMVDYIAHGVVYLHGKLPDLVKEYLESKFSQLPEIRYIIANSVILEGMNLPIDNLYILNTYSINGKELTNLIGRVNRLNTIFTVNENNLDKLLPPVHFVNSNEYNRLASDMSNKIQLLRSRTFKDVVENPTLEEFDIEELNLPKDQKESKREMYKQIRQNEQFLNQVPQNEQQRLKQYLIETGISQFYDTIDLVVDILLERIRQIPSRTDWEALTMLDKIHDLFLKDMHMAKDHEFLRLNSPEARSYYEFHMTVNQKRALKQNIVYQFEYFKKRVTDRKGVFYFGETYGEREQVQGAQPAGRNTYIDLGMKTDTQLINLAIVKLKMEDDFVSFKLNKFIIMMYDYKLISQDDYYLYIYGTTDQTRIGLTKIGLSVSLISRLQTDGQLRYLYFDQFNNLKATPEFDQYKTNVNDFYRFEIERFL